MAWKKFSEEKPKQGCLIILRKPAGLYYFIGRVEKGRDIHLVIDLSNAEYQRIPFDFYNDEWQEVEE